MNSRALFAMFTVSLACACQGGSPTIGSLGQAVQAAPTGSPCLPPDELFDQFGSHGVDEVQVDDAFDGCASRVCVVNHFQGRVGCPYGQTSAQAASAPACFVPHSNKPVTVQVAPQLTGRQADVAAICSCRCAGPGAGPFCECPAGMQCSELMKPTGFAAADAYAGSYCIVTGTAYDPLITTAACDPTLQNCGDPRPY